MNVRVTSACAADLAEALAWYRHRGAGLDRRFLLAFDAALEAIRQHPQIGQEIDRDIRRYLLRGFPYGVFYLVRQDEFIVLGCMHGARDPEGSPGRGAA